ncbi:MAG: Hpt domain-containing protein [Phycisphaerales bacterium]|nr:Hpt domain-containing protein [Phycisphaerales bacterium]
MPHDHSNPPPGPPHGPHSPPLKSSFEGDPDLRDLVDMFVSEMPARIASLEEAWRTGEAHRLMVLSHQLKGSGGGYGFGPIGDAAARVEAALKAGPETLEALRPQFEELIDLCRRAAF